MQLFFYYCHKYYYKLYVLKEYKFIIFQFCRSEIQNESHWAEIQVSSGYVPFWRF